jgi:hypothetical protein
MTTSFQPINPEHTENFDVRRILLPDLPPEWEPVDEEVMRFLEVKPGEIQTLAQHHLEEDIVSRRWFLVRNTWAWRCKNCRQGILPGAIHDYITLSCEPRPFHGLNEVLMFWRKTIGEAGYDSYTMRVGEVIVPINAQEAKKMYFRIEARTGKDLAWIDFRARYLRRYKEYLRALGWNISEVTKDQWELINRAAYRAYEDSRKGGD